MPPSRPENPPLKHQAGKETSPINRVSRILDSRASRVLLIVLLLTPMAGYLAASRIMTNPPNTTPKIQIIIRVDDVQDFGFKDGQLEILKLAEKNNVPLSLSIITKDFSQDKILVDAVVSAVKHGSEVTVHGWIHEDLTNLTIKEQSQQLTQAKTALNTILGEDTNILVPPLFKFNNDTLTAMNETGYNIISTDKDTQPPCIEPNGILNIPSTVDFTDYKNGTWQLKPLQQLLTEVNQSIQSYGYAMIVVHPQELMTGTQMNQSEVNILQDLIVKLSDEYSFTTIQRISKTLTLPQISQK